MLDGALRPAGPTSVAVDSSPASVAWTRQTAACKDINPARSCREMDELFDQVRTSIPLQPLRGILTT